MTEQDLQNSIRLYLSRHGIVSFRTNVIASYTQDGRYVPSSLPKGFSDLFCVLPTGRAMFIEVKTKTGKATPAQISFLERMREQGAIAIIARSVEDVVDALNI